MSMSKYATQADYWKAMAQIFAGAFMTACDAENTYFGLEQTYKDAKRLFGESDAASESSK